MEGESNKLSLVNICHGAALEVFDREVAELMANINDCNTSSSTKRKITLEFIFEPFKDRSGATVTLECKHKLAPVDSVEGNIFFARNPQGEVDAYARDPRQEALFGQQPVDTPRQ